MSASVSIFHRKGVRPNLFHQDSCPKSLVATTVKACVQHVPWPFQSGGDSNCRFGTTGWQVIRARRVNRLSMKINHNQILTWKSKKHKNHPTQIFNPPANIQKPRLFQQFTQKLQIFMVRVIRVYGKGEGLEEYPPARCGWVDWVGDSHAWICWTFPYLFRGYGKSLLNTRWWFQRFFMFTRLGKISNLTDIFRWVGSTTN